MTLRRDASLSVQYIPDRSNCCAFIMKVLFLLFALNQVFAKDEFGTSYLKDRLSCREWACINSRLGLPNSLPSQALYSQVLRSLLPKSWHGVVETVLDGCYANRSKIYSNACPGQALVHCTVDQLIENCPETNLRRKYKCSPVSSVAGLKYMMSQGIYENLEANLADEERPAWFLRLYFTSKCCNLPDIFNSSMLAECGFTKIMHYQRHNRPVTQAPALLPSTETSEDALRIISLPTVPEVADDSLEDPLDCCDMSSFIQPSWRTECDFRMKWDAQDRLTIEQPAVTTTPVPTTTTTTTTTAKPKLDVKVLPLSCTQETCVFRKLNIISESGAVDLDAFSKLLNNLTISNPAWAKAKASVVTKCLTWPLTHYVEECEINKVLACTFDVLSDNCPTSKRHDSCRQSGTALNDTICQISSANYVLKSRHQYCDVPSLVNENILQECGISSLNRLEYSTRPVQHRKFSNICQKLSVSTTCLLSKMGVLSKYNFMDDFEIRDSMWNFAETHEELRYHSDAYFTALDSTPRYPGYCSSPKKLLNLLDAMLMTCPVSKRKSSPKCSKMFNEITITDVNPTARPIKVLLPVYHQIHSAHDEVLRGGGGNLRH